MEKNSRRLRFISQQSNYKRSKNAEDENYKRSKNAEDENNRAALNSLASGMDFVHKAKDSAVYLGPIGRWLAKTLGSPALSAGTGFKKFKAAFSTEDIFYGSRSPWNVAYGELEACEKVGIEENAIEEIIENRSSTSLETTFRSLVALENIAENLSISKKFIESHDLDKDNGNQLAEHIKRQEWRVQMKYKKFFTIKAIVCNKIGFELDVDNYATPVIDEAIIRKEYLRQQIKLMLAEAFESACSTQEEFLGFLHEIESDLLEVQKGSEAFRLPKVAPELYLDRLDKKESPADFTFRVYEPWLGKGISRPHIKELDEALYRNLYRRGLPDSLAEILPKAQGRSASELKLSDAEILQRRRAKEQIRHKKWSKNKNLSSGK